ncbi:CGNR zinc finger domain-containing protein, partial [Streptomyces sp. URMC 126]
MSPHRLAQADAVLAETPVLVTLDRSTWGDRAQPLAPAPGLAPARTALARLAIAWTEVVLTG